MAVSIWEGQKAQELIDAVNNSRSGQETNNLSSSVKAALLNCFQHVAWADENGQTYYSLLERALGEESVPELDYLYSWDASSMVLPTGMTGKSYNFTSEPGSLYISAPSFSYPISANKYEIIIVAKFPKRYGDDWGDSSPTFSCRGFTTETNKVVGTITFNKPGGTIIVSDNWKTNYTFTKDVESDYVQTKVVYNNSNIEIFLNNELLRKITPLDEDPPEIDENALYIISPANVSTGVYLKSIKIKAL